MIDNTEGYLDEILEFAKSINDNSLQKCLDSLKRVEDNTECSTFITRDFADKSFYFVRMVNGKFAGNGGIIFHGSHDNGGDGGSPTFSVNLTPATGWRIHT